MGCDNIHSHIIDSRFFSQGYATDECRRIFCDLRRMQRWLEVEKALAECQAELGIIPQEAAATIIACADIRQIDLGAVREGIAATGHSLVSLLNEWQRVAGEAGQYIHYGATTQDIQDTAQSLELKEATGIIGRDLGAVILALRTLADRYKGLAMVGRTHSRHALPTTLGLKIAGWLDEAIRNHERLAQCRKRLLVSELFGGVGTMDSLSDKALTLVEKFSARLGLEAPLSSWHSSRDRIAEYTTTLAIISGGLARIANEICQLARDEIGEMSEPFESGKIGSSTMPHKRNPELCEQVVVLSRLIKANAVNGLDTLCSEHERDYRAVRLEWIAVMEASSFCSAALALTRKILSGLVVHTDRVRANLEQSAVNISTEALMFLLGEKLGKQTAHQLIYTASMACEDSSALLDTLLARPEVKAHFSRATLEEAIAPQRHTGRAQEIVERVIRAADGLNLDGFTQKTRATCPLFCDNGCCLDK